MVDLDFDALLFDLDDTLMDTYGQLVEPAAREACQAMIDNGLACDIQTAVETRRQLFTTQPRADLYQLMVETMGCEDDADPKQVRDAGHNAFFHRRVERHIKPFPDTIPTLAHLRQSYRLFLITSGHPETQAQKIDILGLGELFESIHLVHPEAGETKGGVFKKIMATNQLKAHRCLVIGDRVNGEIAAANKLGMTSCRMRWGEFLHLEPGNPIEIPDLQLDRPSSLLQLL